MDHKELQNALAKAATIVERGGLIILPTKTVYGLAANAEDADAVARVYKTKARASANPLPLVVADLEKAREFAMVDAIAERLAAEFWPGPLTMVLPLKKGTKLAPAVTAGRDTLALRPADHSIARQLLARVRVPLVLTSANISGKTSPTRVEMIDPEIRAAAEMILDGGPSVLGQESTIIKIVEDRVALLRQGVLAVQVIESLLGFPLESAHD